MTADNTDEVEQVAQRRSADGDYDYVEDYARAPRQARLSDANSLEETESDFYPSHKQRSNRNIQAEAEEQGKEESGSNIQERDRK